MSIDICVKDYQKRVDAEVAATLSPEIIAQASVWKTDPTDQEAGYQSWKVHDRYIAPIEAKYSINMCSGRFLTLMNDILGQDVEPMGEMSGSALEALRERILEAQSALCVNPGFFQEMCTPTSTETGTKGCTIISVGEDVEYYRIRLEQLLGLVERSEGELYWG